MLVLSPHPLNYQSFKEVKKKKSCTIAACHAKAAVPGMYRLSARLVLSRPVSSSVLQSWNLYKPNEWPWNKWAIRLETGGIFTCRVDYDGAESFMGLENCAVFLHVQQMTTVSDVFFSFSPSFPSAKSCLLLLWCWKRTCGAHGPFGLSPKWWPMASCHGRAERERSSTPAGSDVSCIAAGSSSGTHAARAVQPTLCG